MNLQKNEEVEKLKTSVGSKIIIYLVVFILGYITSAYAVMEKNFLIFLLSSGVMFIGLLNVCIYMMVDLTLATCYYLRQTLIEFYQAVGRDAQMFDMEMGDDDDEIPM